jgi:hypothetical protein
MPSLAHETPLELLRLDPALPDWVRTEILGDASVAFDHARLHDPNVRPRTFQADAMIVYQNGEGKPVRGLVYEVQRRFDGRKLGTWKLYVGHLEAEFNTKATLLVYVPSTRVVARFKKAIARDIESSARLVPYFFTPADVPLLVDEETAEAHPTRVLFSAVCHLRDDDIDKIFPALLTVLAAMERARRISYHELTVGKLPKAAKARWEAFLVTTTAGKLYRDDVLREANARGEARGEARGQARGQARAVLRVLRARGVRVSKEARARVLTCTDSGLLELWLDRVGIAATMQDVFGDAS